MKHFKHINLTGHCLHPSVVGAAVCCAMALSPGIQMASAAAAIAGERQVPAQSPMPKTETARYTLSVDNKPFDQAVEAVERATGYNISYSVDDVDSNHTVSFTVSNASLGEVIGALVKGQNLTYTVNRKHVILKKDTARQNAPKGRRLRVEGVVYDNGNEPLVGAVVSVAGTSVAALTDIDGHYSIDVPDTDTNWLQVSYVGFTPVSIAASKVPPDGTLDIHMVPAAGLNLDEVVVVGYGSIKKESLSSAISTIDGESLSNSLSVNTSGALAGKVAGINSRQTDGRPGGYTSITVRNMGTPLYVVDGVQMDEGQFNNIAYSDIESISILKDASAAIYGVRAANGVVVVTTKRGKKNTRNTISLDASYSWQRMFRFPEPADAETYIRARIQSATITGQNCQWTMDDIEKYRSGQLQETNWRDYVIDNYAPMYNVALSATGGSGNMTYYVSAGHTRQESLIRDSGFYQRTNLQSNITADFAENLHFTTQINGRLENTERTAWNRALGWNDAYESTLFSIYNNTPVMRPYANDNPAYPALCGGAVYTNPAILNRTHMGKENDRWFVVQANASLEWEIIKNLKLKGIVSYYTAYETYKGRNKSYKLYNYDVVNDRYNVIQDSKVASAWATSQYQQSFNTQLSLSYRKEWQTGSPVWRPTNTAIPA